MLLDWIPWFRLKFLPEILLFHAHTIIEHKNIYRVTNCKDDIEGHIIEKDNKFWLDAIFQSENIDPNVWHIKNERKKKKRRLI